METVECEQREQRAGDARTGAVEEELSGQHDQPGVRNEDKYLFRENDGLQIGSPASPPPSTFATRKSTHPLLPCDVTLPLTKTTYFSKMVWQVQDEFRKSILPVDCFGTDYTNHVGGLTEDERKMGNSHWQTEKAGAGRLAEPSKGNGTA
ncbi:hypothetical protein M427DRAFT_53837 [Gonapodya prolifera JEL478]|uniref:Uncharacterized protein n=1 Tax=Gonapodya prolifera (strain JEL478) TaxID=1344416 RepID=A0A139ANZ3_GONPJ|nr:hypothetical protein M427DRAFT_53837 [Gonapodya prolifera JEL478]|eukprot:KXS18456.1 hypothetical protein M427DRAFT_53837 [Gonapodya prolifera JEL478]